MKEVLIFVKKLSKKASLLDLPVAKYHFSRIEFVFSSCGGRKQIFSDNALAKMKQNSRDK
jgi:hypothetical protein